MGLGGQRYVPAALPPGKSTRYPLYRRLCGLERQSGWVQKISPTHRDSIPRTAQPVACRYTDYAVVVLPVTT